MPAVITPVNAVASVCKQSDVRPVHHVITVEQAIRLAQAQGYRILEIAT